MKITTLIARYLLGLLFVVFGLNGFLHFIPTGPMPTGAAGQFMAAVMVGSHYMTVVFAIQLVAGLLLLVGQYVPLALTLLAPVIVNVVMFHAFMAPEGLPLAVITTVLWLIAAYPVRSVFAVLLRRNVTV
jgi:uncharacterized membrane protein YphA (DoxX/SURF4 family)